MVVLFNLEKDIPGLAKSGSLVVGQVIKKEKLKFSSDEEIIIVFRKIITEEGREVSIDKTLEIKGN